MNDEWRSLGGRDCVLGEESSLRLTQDIFHHSFYILYGVVITEITEHSHFVLKR